MDGRTWLAASFIRVVRTTAAASLGALGAAALLQDVQWDVVLGTAGLSAVATTLMCLAGLPEAHTASPIERYINPELDNVPPPPEDPDHGV